MQVKVDLFGPLREVVGQKTVTVDAPAGATVGEVLADVVDDHPGLRGDLLEADGTIPDSVNVTYEGTDVRHLDGAATPVSDGGVVRAAPPVVGG